MSTHTATHSTRSPGVSCIEITAWSQVPRNQPRHRNYNFRFGFNHQSVSPPFIGNPGFGEVNWRGMFGHPVEPQDMKVN
jgi:hypothetical protein